MLSMDLAGSCMGRTWMEPPSSSLGFRMKTREFHWLIPSPALRYLPGTPCLAPLLLLPHPTSSCSEFPLSPHSPRSWTATVRLLSSDRCCWTGWSSLGPRPWWGSHCTCRQPSSCSPVRLCRGGRRCRRRVEARLRGQASWEGMAQCESGGLLLTAGLPQAATWWRLSAQGSPS